MVKNEDMRQPGNFEDLATEGGSIPVEGWDFAWFDGRATEERPSWGYARLLTDRLSRVSSALDIQTGGGEVFAGALGQLDRLPKTLVATESWPPNVAVARQNLESFTVTVTEVNDDEPLPFISESIDLVVSRHPTIINWSEIARVLRPGGTYLSQQVGPGTNRELTDFIMGVQPVSESRSPEGAVVEAMASRLEVVDLRQESLRVEFNDVAAVIYFLRKVLWTVPDFSVDRYREQLRRLYQVIEDEGCFISHAQRYLIEVVKPDHSGQ